MTSKSNNPGAGLGDPYWYEWSIGLMYVLDLLDDAKNVSSVTLQKSGYKGLDDVVVAFSNGQSRFIQVKHTRSEDSLTFGDLVTGSGKQDSLLKDMAAGWVAAGKPGEVWLVTNRKASIRHYTPTALGTISRPPLADFISWLEAETENASNFSDLKVGTDWEDAWEKLWLAELSVINTDTDRLAFLKAFRVFHSKPDLSELLVQLRERLEELFIVPSEVADGLLARLDSALRVWATSDRGAAEPITKEIAYEKLCLQEDTVVGDHDFPPPAPFFPSRMPAADAIVALLQNRNFPIVFITGEPGSGKTALLSHLANQRDPVIGARFHAYRPITPENQLLPADSEVTQPRTLWSDLLVKLRSLARGRLFQLQVPIHAASLTVEALRHHVLRLANALGEAEGRPFVIAIDGIDHAARAGKRSETFLGSLVPPEEVPDHVIFLIGGQPSEGYQRQYPSWLRSSATGVETYSLPRLSLCDTRALVEARLATSNAVTESVTRDVHAACDGHTLSTVFAVEEAILVDKVPERLPERLTNRKLTSGVEGYYESIWSAATREFLGPTSLRLASCLVLARSRASGEMVRAVVDPGCTFPLNWTDVLRKLRPLVVEESSGFRVFHNDFRVFLHGLLEGDVEAYKECASLLGDYLLDSDDRLACHAGVQKLFGIAGRHRDQATLFTPHYVIEGHAIGRPLTELTEQALVSAKALSMIDADWHLAHEVGVGLKTLEQLRASAQWRNGLESADTVALETIAPRAVERSVPVNTDWTLNRVKAAVEDILELSSLGEYERAQAAFKRWFAGLSPKDIADLAQLEPGFHGHQQEEATRSLLTELGSASISTTCLLKPSKKNGKEGVEAAYARGLLDSADSPSVRERTFVAALRRIRQFFLGDVEKLLWRLIEGREWRRCGLILQAVSPQLEYPWSLSLSGAVAAAILGNSDLEAKWTTSILADRDKAVSDSVNHTGLGSDEPSQITVMTRLALLFGVANPYVDASTIREEIETVYHSRDRRDERHDPGVAELLHAAALLGSLIRNSREGKSAAHHCNPARVRQTVTTLVTAIELRPYKIPIGYPQIAASIMRGILDCANQLNGLFSAIAEPLLDLISQNKTLGPMLTPVWRFLAQATYRQELLSYADAWVGSNGIAWSLSLAERHEFVTEFATLLKEIGEFEMAEQALKRLPWTEIGYTGHKDYSLNQAFEWFQQVSIIAPCAWEKQGLQLFSISLEATRTGDNRLGRSIEKALLSAACLDGPSSFARIAFSVESEVPPSSDALAYALISMLDTKTLPRADLLSIWAFCIGQNCWRVYGDRQVIADVRDACLANAKRGEVRDLDKDLRHLGPAEFACEQEPETSSLPFDQDGPDYSSLNPIDAIQLAATHQDWKQVLSSLLNAEAVGGGFYAECVNEAWRALERRDDRPWWWDGAYSVYKHIFPLISPSQRWEAVGRTVRADHFSFEEGKVQTIQENLDAMCQLVASQSGLRELQAGLDRQLEMHTFWIEAAGFLPPIAQVPVDASSSLTTWPQVFMNLLLLLLEYDEQTYAQSALRGIFALLKINPNLLPGLLERVPDLRGLVGRRIMLIAEAVAVHDTEEHFCEWLVGIMKEAPRLDMALSAWSTLLVAARFSERFDCSWPEPTDEPQLIAASSAPLISVATEQMGLYKRSARPSLNLLKFLETACGENIDDVESEFASSIRYDPPEVNQSRRRGGVFGDFVLDPKDEGETDRLFEVIRRHERKGRFYGIEVGRLAQALVPAADPFVFLRTPSPHTQAGSWPIDSALDQRILESSDKLTYDLIGLLSSDLPDNLHVLGGSVTSYSGEWDYKVIMHHRLPGVGAGSPEPSLVLNARTSLLLRDFDLISGPGSGKGWLTQGVYGLFPFIDGLVDIFPSPKWQELGWKPSLSDPTQWVREGKIVAWYERLLGPVRRIYGGDLIYRHPILTRWVCYTDEWNRLCDHFGEPERTIFPFHARIGSH